MRKMLLLGIIFYGMVGIAFAQDSLNVDNAKDIVELGVLVDANAPIYNVEYLANGSLVYGSAAASVAAPDALLPIIQRGERTLAVSGDLFASAATIGNTHNIVVYNAATGDLVLQTEPTEETYPDLALSPDGKWLVAAGNVQRVIYLWDLTSGVRRDINETAFARVVAFNEDGSLLASGTEDGTITLYDTSSWERDQVLLGNEDDIYALAFRPGHHELIAAGSELINLWDIPTGRLLYSFVGSRGETYAADFSPDGDLLATGGEDTVIYLWNVETRDNLIRLEGHNNWIQGLTFSADGRFLVSGAGGFNQSGNTIRLWGLAGTQPDPVEIIMPTPEPTPNQ